MIKIIKPCTQNILKNAPRFHLGGLKQLKDEVKVAFHVVLNAHPPKNVPQAQLFCIFIRISIFVLS